MILYCLQYNRNNSNSVTHFDWIYFMTNVSSGKGLNEFIHDMPAYACKQGGYIVE